MNRVAIVGGGAAGIFSAIIAARNGADVTIYEKSNRVGKKILATGNGRCNYTNRNILIENYHGSGRSIVEGVFSIFSNDDVLEFFDELGILPYEGDEGKIYPRSLQASSLLDVMRMELEKLGVEEKIDTEVVKLRKMKDGFDIITKNEIFDANNVIICTGGFAGSQFGCDGSGYKMAAELGIKKTKIFPALVQLKCDSKFLKKISGVKFNGVASLYCDGEKIASRFGEILFTDYGISGPPILQISRHANQALEANKEVKLALDLFSEYTDKDLFNILRNRLSKDKKISDAMIGLINKKLITVILQNAIGDYKNKKSLNNLEIKSIAYELKNFELNVIGSKTWNQAQTTAGGIEIDEVNCTTMMSNKIDGLYFAGEVLDVDGDCGGFNLQWAWSSAYIAGINAAYNIE